jgi:hypothetical protein
MQRAIIALSVVSDEMSARSAHRSSGMIEPALAGAARSIEAFITLRKRGLPRGVLAPL